MRMASNNKLPETVTNKRKKKRVQRQERKKVTGVKVGAVEDPELMSEHILKKRKTCQRANITLSGKKKQKIWKQLKRLQKEKSAMDADTAAPTNKSKSSRDSDADAPDVVQDLSDVEMDE